MPELNAIARYNRLAQQARRQGAMDQALLYLANALRLSREVGRPLLEAFARNLMGQVYAQHGRPDLAACCYRTALALLGQSGSRPGRRHLEQAISQRLAAHEGAAS